MADFDFGATGSYGAAVAWHLTEQGVTVLEVGTALPASGPTRAVLVR